MESSMGVGVPSAVVTTGEVLLWHLGHCLLLVFLWPRCQHAALSQPGFLPQSLTGATGAGTSWKDVSVVPVSVSVCTCVSVCDSLLAFSWSLNDMQKMFKRKLTIKLVKRCALWHKTEYSLNTFNSFVMQCVNYVINIRIWYFILLTWKGLGGNFVNCSSTVLSFSN